MTRKRRRADAEWDRAYVARQIYHVHLTRSFIVGIKGESLVQIGGVKREKKNDKEMAVAE